MKVFVTGIAGQLGHDVMNELAARGHEGIGSDLLPQYSGIADGSAVTRAPYVPLDITDGEAVARELNRLQPDAVVHCAGWTNVDGAEIPEKRQLVTDANVRGTENIARECSVFGCKMLYISTDYVFGGTGEEPWNPDSSVFAPLNVYGETKLGGELAVRSLLNRYFIVRISWAFGANGGNFVKTMLDLGKKHESVRVVCDQIGTPTYTLDLARLLADMIETEKYGVYHATNEGGYISWADFAREIFRQAGMATQVVPVTTAEYGLSKAARPFNSRLDKKKLMESGFTPLPDWRDALGRYLKALSTRQES